MNSSCWRWRADATSSAPDSSFDVRLDRRGDQAGLLPIVCSCRMPVAGAAAGARPEYSSSCLCAERLLQAVADLVPGALVLRLFLAPHHLAGVRIVAQRRRVVLARERIELLDAHDRDVAQFLGPARLEQVEIDLARAEHDAAHLGGRQVVDLVDHLVEEAVRQIVERRHRQLVPQQALRASSRPAACGSRAASAGAACGTSAPASTARTPTCCSRRTAAGSARAAPRSAPGPALRSRAAGTA